MIIITLVCWSVLYGLARRFITHTYKKTAAIATFLASVGIELWFTQDLVRLVIAKSF